MGMLTAKRRRGHDVRRKALHQVRHGAYKKAVASVTTSVASFSPEDGARHAATLLPRSGAVDALATAPPVTTARHALGHPSAAESMDIPTHYEGGPLRGVKYSALTAPGPSGMRPEHAREMLAVARRPL
eukprot:10823229-Karenia_brevis.AAC.1